ncbi:conjugative transfer ATPase [Aliivibrio fischeri]|uniref:conjugative transfer ATPase n=1 Tax=Aliivibrio fischeri TaxID=668 RepID=UPI0007C4DD13|nr:conjugative transfer ATPase [Aliivibrio fischeri]
MEINQQHENTMLSQLIYSVRATLSHMLDPNKAKGTKPITKSAYSKLYEKNKYSLGSYMPYLGYEQDKKVFVFDDCESCAVVFDVKPIATEGRSKNYLALAHKTIEDALSSQFNELSADEGEWVVQQYRWKDNDLASLADEAYLYADDFAREHEVSKVVLKDIMKKHLGGMSKDGGLFEDTLITKQPFEGGIERTKIVIYRKYGPKAKRNKRFNPVNEISKRAKALQQDLKIAGVELLQNDEFDFFHWLVKFFNEKPIGMDTTEYYKSITPRCDENGDLPDDIPANLIHSLPIYNDDEGVWQIGNTYHKVIRVAALRGHLDVGQLTGEVRVNESVTCCTDMMPSGTMMCMTTVFCTKEYIESKMAKLNAVSQSNLDPENKRTRDNIGKHREILGNKEVRATLTGITCYVRSNDLSELDERVNTVCTALNGANMTPIKEVGDINDPLSSNAFIFNLPMCFDPTEEDAKLCLTPMYLHHVVSASFFYGREVGTGNPLLLMFNRSGGLLTTDILRKSDREANSHMLLIGSTGSGKSATLVYLTLLLIAIKRPRLYIVEAGGSFNHVAEFLKYYGMSVNKLTLAPSSKNHKCPNLAPFSDIHKLVDDGVIELTKQENLIAVNNREEGKSKIYYSESEFDSVKLEDVAFALKDLSLEIEAELERAKQRELEALKSGFDDEADEQQDRLGQLELIAFTIITSGDEKEIDRYTQGDRRILKQALRNVGKKTYINNEQGSISKIADELDFLMRNSSDITELGAERINEMVNGLKLYCEGFEGELLNTETETEVFPDCDVTIIDLATLAKPGNESLLAIVYIGLLQRLNSLAEKYQHTGRLMIKITDECHLITKNDLTALYIVKVVKLWRKLNGFAWFATQNLDDFPKEAEKMLSMIEWIMMLVPKPKEIKHLCKYKTISDEQISMAKSAKKLDKCYTEGVLFGEIFNALFRLVQPSEMLGMAGTDGEEKKKLAELSKEHSNEVHGLFPLWQASILHAVQLDKARGIEPIVYPYLQDRGLYDV